MLRVSLASRLPLSRKQHSRVVSSFFSTQRTPRRTIHRSSNNPMRTRSPTAIKPTNSHKQRQEQSSSAVSSLNARKFSSFALPSMQALPFQSQRSLSKPSFHTNQSPQVFTASLIVASQAQTPDTKASTLPPVDGFQPSDILNFWFKELDTPRQWFFKDPQLDELLRQRFLPLHTKAIDDKLAPWRATPEGSLAEIIILDQFSRNMFRNTPQAFASDEKARELVYTALEKHFEDELAPIQQAFLYMPLMHSEHVKDHELALQLYAKHEELKPNYIFEQKHKDIIDRFGRYPHRNDILGRKSTPEEVEFLTQPGSSF